MWGEKAQVTGSLSVAPPPQKKEKMRRNREGREWFFLEGGVGGSRMLRLSQQRAAERTTIGVAMAGLKATSLCYSYTPIWGKGRMHRNRLGFLKFLKSTPNMNQNIFRPKITYCTEIC